MRSATLDTNVYVSALQFGGIGASLLGMARAGLLRLDISDAILNETIHKFGWDGYRLQDFRRRLLTVGNRVIPAETLDVVADDPDDNRILECAIEARSQFLITRDKDLLRLVRFREVVIIPPERFVEIGDQL